MLIADPSSACDICYQIFSATRECFSIPCGHVFCLQCLDRLDRMVCPLCRNPVGNPQRIRKIHVDLSKCVDQEAPKGLRRVRKLEEQVVSEALDPRNLTVQRAAELSMKIHNFVRTQPANEYALLRAIESLLGQLSSAKALAYEESSHAKAVKASYEDRIKELEKKVKEKARQPKRFAHESGSLNPAEPAQLLVHSPPPAMAQLKKNSRY